MPITDHSDSLVTRNLTVEDSLELGADTGIEFKEMAAPVTPPAGSVVAYAKADGKLYAKNDTGTELDLTSGGEANTASNVGTGGTGVFKQKTGTNLEFKKINAGSAKITITNDVANSEVDVDLGSVALTDLSDVSAKTGTGTTAVMQGSPLLTTPTITDFINATHSHQNAAGGGALDAAAIASGTLPTARIADEAVTYAKMQHLSATDKLLGRSTAGAGDVEEITCTAAGRALIDDADAAAQRTTLELNNIGARVYNSSNITISSALQTALTFDSERWDTDAIHSTSTNTGRLTCQTAGLYVISAHVRWAASSLKDLRTIGIKLNGTTYIALNYFEAISDDFLDQQFSVTTLYKLAVNDYVELFVRQDSGSNLDIKVAGNFSPEFAMQRIVGD